MFRTIGLTPFCAGLLGSESALDGVAGLSGTDSEAANGLFVNSVARGDTKASSLSSSAED